MPVDTDVGSGSIVRFMGIGSVSGLNSFLALVDWEGLGEEDILSLREKSSGSASGVGRDTTYCCFRGEGGDCRGGTEGTGFGFGFASILSDFSLGRVELKYTGLG